MTSRRPPPAWFDLAALPPMGWNSWNQCHEDVTEQVVLAAAEALVDNGMASAGYRYVVVDDCWQAAERNSAGQLVADPARFPSGMEALADRVHDLGLLFGIYSAPGERTCAGRLGSLGHEQQDADLFAEWGVDFLKYDWCGAGAATAENEARVFTVMRDALLATGRDIVYSISEYGVGRPWHWGRGVAHLWRTTFDIWPNWPSVSGIFQQQIGITEFSGPGGWNDPDMLQIGNGTLTPAENRSHLALWCLLSAPLFIGTDIAALDAETVALLRHPGLLSIGQDAGGRSAAVVAVDAHTEFLVKDLADGTVVVAAHNRSVDRRTVAVPSSAMAGRPASQFSDVWSGTDSLGGDGGLVAEVDPRGTALWRSIREE